MTTSDGIPSNGPEPDWKFDLKPPTDPNPAQIPIEETKRATAAWQSLQQEKMAIQALGMELDELIDRWHREGFTADQIAVAARLPIDTVKTLLAHPGVVALLTARG